MSLGYYPRRDSGSHVLERTFTVPIGKLILLATSLFSIISPPAAMGPIAAVSGDRPRPAQRRMAIQVAGSYAVVLVIAAWVGQWLLKILGVTVAGLTATGGLALLLAGLPLMLQGRKGQPTEEQIEGAGENGSNEWHGEIPHYATVNTRVLGLAIKNATRVSLAMQVRELLHRVGGENPMCTVHLL